MRSQRGSNRCREDVEQILDSALADELPLNKRDGGFIRDRFDGDLDEHRKLQRRQPPGDRRAADALTPRRPASNR